MHGIIFYFLFISMENEILKHIKFRCTQVHLISRMMDYVGQRQKKKEIKKKPTKGSFDFEIETHKNYKMFLYSISKAFEICFFFLNRILKK